MKYIDMHVHLTNEKYQEDLKEVIKEDMENGLTNALLIGCDEEEIVKSIKLQKEYPDYMYLALGFHPVDVKNIKEENLAFLEENLKENKSIIALGEIGLDYHWYPEEKELQKEYFKKQIDLAKKYNKPLIIHARESVDDCYDILLEKNYFNGIMHSFSEDYESAKRFVDKGMYISISGPVTFKNGKSQKDVVKNIDLNKLLIETDGPYLTPEPNRGKRNQSKYLKYVVKEIASIREIEEEEIANILHTNSLDFIERNYDA